MKELDKPHYCFLCGAHLIEVGLDVFECVVCHCQLISTISQDGEEISLHLVK
jgi:hypothetical protein